MQNSRDDNSRDDDKNLPKSLFPFIMHPQRRDSSTRTTLLEPASEDEHNESSSSSPFVLRPVSGIQPHSSRPYPSYESSQMRLPVSVPSARNHTPYVNTPGSSSHFLNLQQQQQPEPYPRSFWPEDQPGPSTMAQRNHHYYNESRGRRPEYPARAPSVSYRYSDQYTPHQSYRREFEHPDYGAYNQGHAALPSHTVYYNRPDQQELYMLSSPLPQTPASATPVARGWDPPLSAGSSSSDYNARAAYPSLPPVVSRPSPEPDDDDDNDGEYLPPGRRPQKRKLEDPEERPGTGAKRTKKTPIACDFCRGRKLRCDGTRPSCWNCKSRENQVCVYQSQPRRRGPGKAPKGQRKKKAAAAEAVSDRQPTSSNEGSQSYEEHLPFPPSLPQGGPDLPPGMMQSQDQGGSQRYYRRTKLRRIEDGANMYARHADDPGK